MDNYYKLCLTVKKENWGRLSLACVTTDCEVCMHSMSTYDQTFALVFQKDRFLMMFSLSGKNDPFFAFFFFFFLYREAFRDLRNQLAYFTIWGIDSFWKRFILFNECFSYIYVCALYACLVFLSDPLKLELQLIVCAGNWIQILCRNIKSS